MIIVTVARKPMGSTVARNVTEHGTGALNINGTRLRLANGEEIKSLESKLDNRLGVTGPNWRKGDQEKMATAQKESIERTNSLGRWPANFLLQHAAGCTCDGVKKVKSRNANLKTETTGYNIGLVVLHGLKRLSGTWGHADEDNQETVQNWVCAPGCPVRALDEQSGTLPSGVAVRRNQGKSQEGMFAFGNRGPEEDVGYADQGTASRFFKQFRSDP